MCVTQYFTRTSFCKRTSNNGGRTIERNVQSPKGSTLKGIKVSDLQVNNYIFHDYRSNTFWTDFATGENEWERNSFTIFYNYYQKYLPAWKYGSFKTRVKWKTFYRWKYYSSNLLLSLCESSTPLITKTLVNKDTISLVYL